MPMCSMNSSCRWRRRPSPAPGAAALTSSTVASETTSAAHSSRNLTIRSRSSAPSDCSVAAGAKRRSAAGRRGGSRARWASRASVAVGASETSSVCTAARYARQKAPSVSRRGTRRSTRFWRFGSRARSATTHSTSACCADAWADTSSVSGHATAKSSRGGCGSASSDCDSLRICGSTQTARRMDSSMRLWRSVRKPAVSAMEVAATDIARRRARSSMSAGRTDIVFASAKQASAVASARR